MKSTIVIPARLESTRLPRKLLIDIWGQPMLWHVWNQAKQVESSCEIIVATDSKEILNKVEGWGGQAILTSPACSSGTDRIASIIDKINGDIIINLQGDEPLINPNLLGQMIRVLTDSSFDIVTPVRQINDADELTNPNVVKVVQTQYCRALYFSRSAIPFVRGEASDCWLRDHKFWAHIGVYGYRRKVLENYFDLEVSPLEKIEKLEQIRFLEAGFEIRTLETEYQSISVDTEEDLKTVKKIMRNKR